MDGYLWAFDNRLLSFMFFVEKLKSNKLNDEKLLSRKLKELTIIAGRISDGTANGATVAGRSIEIFVFVWSMMVQVSRGRCAHWGFVP